MLAWQFCVFPYALINWMHLLPWLSRPPFVLLGICRWSHRDGGNGLHTFILLYFGVRYHLWAEALPSQDVRKLQIQTPRRKANPYPRVAEAKCSYRKHKSIIAMRFPSPNLKAVHIVHAYPGHFSGIIAALPLISTGSKVRWEELFPCPEVTVRAALVWLWPLPVISDLTLAYHFSSIANWAVVPLGFSSWVFIILGLRSQTWTTIPASPRGFWACKPRPLCLPSRHYNLWAISPALILSSFF